MIEDEETSDTQPGAGRRERRRSSAVRLILGGACLTIASVLVAFGAGNATGAFSGAFLAVPALVVAAVVAAICAMKLRADSSCRAS